MQDEVDRFRAEYRARHIGPGYSGRAHFAFTVSFASALMGLALTQLEAVQPLEWLTVPLTFLYANFAEYFGHRGPMHHPRRGLGRVFERHTRQHHRFFTDQRMAYDEVRDFKAVLFPPVLVSFFLLAFGTPVALLLGLLFGANVAWLFAFTGTAYFLNYELLHFAYHLPPQHPLARLPGLARLRRHHTLHHDPRLMSHWHFNISYPIADALLGTRRPPGS
ncbi:MAG TPA: hypothetical protein VFV27_05005 [Nevskiaceae bacterium]|nr:hypothetical protein [Nevskiaceae bacterium]